MAERETSGALRSNCSTSKAVSSARRLPREPLTAAIQGKDGDACKPNAPHRRRSPTHRIVLGRVKRHRCNATRSCCWNMPRPEAKTHSGNSSDFTSGISTITCTTAWATAQLAEDAFQNTFLQLHRKCRQFQPGRRLRPWLYTIAANQAVDLLRRNRRHKAVSLSAAAGDAGCDHGRRPCGGFWEAQAADPGEQLNVHEDRERTHLAMRLVPARVRQVLMLVVYQGLPYREAAETLGIPLGTLKSRMHKALQCLREALLVTSAHGLQEDRDSRLLLKT